MHERKRVARVEMSETDEAEGLYTKDWMEVKHTHLRAMICGKNYKSHGNMCVGCGQTHAAEDGARTE
ncbi:MAG: hypothetical protein ACTHLB_06255 [Parafilimonas sp.]